MNRLLVAEEVLPGHPDRLADGIAEALVEFGVGVDAEALVGVEVAVHRDRVFVTGRVAAGDVTPHLNLEHLVRQVYQRAGYSKAWALDLEVASDLDLGPLSAEERGIRRFSDDQNVVVASAWGFPALGYMSPECAAARAVRDSLTRLRQSRPDVLGPDGKTLVVLEDLGDGAVRWRRLNIAMQHVPEAALEELFALVLPATELALASLEPYSPGIHSTFSPEVVRLNGAGDFSRGGPHGDNGLSGKKLVVDHGGPGTPIGGGALCGKDPHKVDRVGALNARHLAVKLLGATGGALARVTLGYLPGQAAPDFLQAELDGALLDEVDLAAMFPLPDLSIAATVDRFGLTRVRWTDVLRTGYFGGPWAWEEP